MSKVEDWLKSYGDYYRSQPNEIIRAHRLLAAMEAIAADLAAKAESSQIITPEPPDEPQTKAQASP